MDRDPTSTERAGAKVAFAGRLRLIRQELYGEQGEIVLAGRLRLPTRTWINYECGVAIPGLILLEFLELTGTEPRWLHRGVGEKYRLATEESP